MSDAIDFAAWRAKRLAAAPAPRTTISAETQERLRAYQVLSTTAQHAPRRVTRYARAERWQRKRFGRVELCLFAAALFIGALLRWLA